MLKAFAGALKADIVTTAVHGPMMRLTEAEYGITADGTAIIETAQACGLTLVDEEERNPMRATSYGVGELSSVGIQAWMQKVYSRSGRERHKRCGHRHDDGHNRQAGTKGRPL